MYGIIIIEDLTKLKMVKDKLKQIVSITTMKYEWWNSILQKWKKINQFNGTINGKFICSYDSIGN